MIRRLVVRAGFLAACLPVPGHVLAQYYYQSMPGTMIAPASPQFYSPAAMFDPMAAQEMYSQPAFEAGEIRPETSYRGVPASQAAFLQAEMQPGPQTFATPPTSEEPSPTSVESPFEELPMSDGQYVPLGPNSEYSDAAYSGGPPHPHGGIHILKVPGLIGPPCCCPDGAPTGNCDHDLKRYLTKEEALNDPCCDPHCLVCVKEPFLCQKSVMEEAEVVFFRCLKYTKPFCDARCEDQRCIQETGQRTVKKLEPCTVKVKFPCKKTVIDYRTVWICIKCKEKPPYGP